MVEKKWKPETGSTDRSSDRWQWSAKLKTLHSSNVVTKYKQYEEVGFIIVTVRSFFFWPH